MLFLEPMYSQVSVMYLEQEYQQNMKTSLSHCQSQLQLKTFQQQREKKKSNKIESKTTKQAKIQK